MTKRRDSSAAGRAEAERCDAARPGNRQSADAHECARASVPRAEPDNQEPKSTANDSTVKRVVSVDLDTLHETELARFRLRDGKVEAEYRSDTCRQDIEANGIVAYDRVVYPGDGRAFFAALDNAYGNSSRVYVEAIADPDRDNTPELRGCAESNAADGAWE